MMNVHQRKVRTMYRVSRKDIYTLAAVILLILFAALLRRITFPGNKQLNVMVGFMRPLIYVVLFTAWGVMLYQRIIQTQVRWYLVLISVSMVFWIVVRTLKFRVFTDPFADRMCWYSYYVPMLFIPVLSLFAAISLGKPENYRTPKLLNLLFVPTVTLVLLVLTNDCHQFVFRFPPALPWTDSDYAYAPAYLIVIIWIGICTVTALAIVLAKCRISHKKRIIWLPFVPFGLLIAYITGYIMQLKFIYVAMGDITVSLCILIAAILESCIQCGFITSNSHYNELLNASTISAQITDTNYNICYSAANSIPVEKNILKEAEYNPVMQNATIRLSHAPIHKGHVFWQDDISVLLSVLDELGSTREELQSYGTLLEEENKQKQHRRQLEEQKRLYLEVRRKTSASLKLLSSLSSTLQCAADCNEAKKTLGKIIVIGAYLKRRSNLIYQPAKETSISSGELLLCLKESALNLRRYGVICAVKQRYGGEMTSETAGTLYDFFEASTELSLDGLTALTAFIDGDSDSYGITLYLQSEADFTPVLQHFPTASFTRENDVFCGKLFVKGGVAL